MRYIRIMIFIDGAWFDEVRYAGGDKHEYLLDESTSTIEELNDIVTELGYKYSRIIYSYFKDVKLTHKVDITDDNSVEDFVRVAKRRTVTSNAYLFVDGITDDDEGGSTDEFYDDNEGVEDVGARMGIGESDEEEEEEVSFRVGQTFDTRDEFKEAIFKYAMNEKMNIKLTKSEKLKVGARCRNDGCPWKIYGSKNSIVDAHRGVLLWTVRRFEDIHTCSRDGQVKVLTAKKIAAHFKDEFRCNNTHLYAVDMREMNPNL